MAAPVVQVEGARELRASLRKAGDDLSDFKEAHRKVGVYVGTRAAVAAPHRSGNLAASMRAGAVKTQALVRFGSRRVPYATVIHWGWPGHHIAENPFASKAAVDSQPVWLPWYARQVDVIVGRVRGD